MLVDRKGTPKGIMRAGDQKCLQTDRVILASGPAREVEIVRDIFHMYVDDRLSHRKIANVLNRRGIRTERGNRWTQHAVALILRNERYIGNLVYNHTSYKLQSKRKTNPKARWIRCDGVIAPIVAPEMFAAAQRRLDEGWDISDNDLLNHLTAVWCIRGWLSCKNMVSVANTPVANTYRERFGSLAGAFRLLGYKKTHNYRYSRVAARLHAIDRDLVCRLTSSASPHLALRYDSDAEMLWTDEKISLATVVLPYSQKGLTRRAGWWLYFGFFPKSDLLLVTRMTEDNNDMLDRHLLPYPVRPGPTYRFTSEHMSTLSPYRMNAMADFLDIFRTCREGQGPLAWS